MPNAFEKIAEKEKQKALAKQEADIERFARKVADELSGDINDLSLKDSVAQLATNVAEAIVLSNEKVDQKLSESFSQLLAAVKANKPDNSSQIDLSLKIAETLAGLELSPTINVSGVSQEQLKTELAAIVSLLPDDSKRIVSVAYENAMPDKYLNVRLTDGINFYKASGRGGGGTAFGATEAKQEDIVAELQTLNSLVPAQYDYIDLSYTGDNLTGVVFKQGGSGGITISTLTLAYSGANLVSVTKT